MVKYRYGYDVNINFKYKKVYYIRGKREKL